MDPIYLSFPGIQNLECLCAILVPKQAIDEPGLMKMMSADPGPNSKHEVFALAQTAFFSFDDEELNILDADGVIRVQQGDESHRIEEGMVIYRLMDGSIHAAAQANQPKRKLLDAANRYCTRWIRLDI